MGTSKKKTAEKNQQETFITLPSAMNYFEEVTDEMQVADPSQYPDFFDDGDSMNRYLW
ncbi:hypothetical protein [Flavobacterium silvaticum]|uniref:Uncharacterized protein n=1 Tax=Flavobacterium silvaticum TaxID=1852020 RepID=A0A972JF55_9FLAO|nr:hypothetical protein [Flavobacterium silvaticum]NMH27599.1 hypothetical protein [Flavobacterium silvaticum]